MPAIELDDLKIAWQTLNRNLERQHALALHQFKETKLTRFRSGLRPLVAGQIIQLIAGALMSVLSARFWLNHLGAVHLMACGLLLHAYGIMLILFAARDLALIHRVDYAAPVVAIQKQLARLRAWRIRAAVWFGVTGCFIWIPLMLVIFHALGADVWVKNPHVIYWFLVSSFVSVAVLCAIVYWSRRPGQSKFAKHLQDNSAGRAVNRAQAVLDEIERFERE
jgi:hypothetical protein